jgi:hypothetical protein
VLKREGRRGKKKRGNIRSKKALVEEEDDVFREKKEIEKRKNFYLYAFYI